MTLTNSLLFCVCALSATAFCTSPGGPANREFADHLGNVRFPTSCNVKAQRQIISGVGFLHSFQYKQSEEVFQQAAQADPQCAIAHWGEAMALYHQLWDNPDANALKQGHDDIAAALKINSGTPLEKGYISAAAAYFQDDPKLNYAERTEAYSSAMEKVSNANPDDTDAASFYALSLISLAYKEKGRTCYPKHALAILLPLFVSHPDHPGVAHYIIHAADTPELAPQGLEAARKYAQIAPDSSHALHMPSHIFTRLGLWQESIDSNIAAASAAEKASKLHQAEAHYQIHPMDFLDYSYIQTGQASEAHRVVHDLKGVPGASKTEIVEHQSYFSARNALDLQQWKVAAELPLPDLPLKSLESAYWAKSIGAARSGDAAASRENLAHLKQAIAARSAADMTMGCDMKSGPTTSELEAQGWLAYAEGRADDAVNSLRAAAERQEADGIDSVVIPAREMLADLLMELKRTEEALREYQNALKESPNRFDSLYGAAVASQATGNRQAAADYAAKLRKNCPPSADRTEILRLPALRGEK
jgi:tetratricopeptide (TPR) repeat protein